MNDIEFSGEKTDSPWEPQKTPTMVKWVMRTGIARNETQANYILVGLAVVFFILTLVVMIDGNTTSQQGVMYIEDIPEKERVNIPPEILKTLPSRFE